MWESEADLRALQAQIDASATGAQSPQLRDIFSAFPPLTAEQVVALFPGRQVAAVGTVTSKGEPRVAPVDVMLVRGRFFFGTTASSLRARHLKRRPGVSLAYFEGDDAAVLVHGQAVLLEPGTPGFAEADEAFQAIYGGSAVDLGPDVVFFRIEPSHIYTKGKSPYSAEPR